MSTVCFGRHQNHVTVHRPIDVTAGAIYICQLPHVRGRGEFFVPYLLGLKPDMTCNIVMFLCRHLDSEQI